MGGICVFCRGERVKGHRERWRRSRRVFEKCEHCQGTGHEPEIASPKKEKVA